MGFSNLAREIDDQAERDWGGQNDFSGIQPAERLAQREPTAIGANNRQASFVETDLKHGCHALQVKGGHAARDFRDDACVGPIGGGGMKELDDHAGSIPAFGSKRLAQFRGFQAPHQPVHPLECRRTWCPSDRFHLPHANPFDRGNN
jgi:hypothetical protein